MGPYNGMLRKAPFGNKEQFEKWKKTPQAEFETVVEEGVSEQRADELCRQTPLSTMLRISFHVSTDPKTGVVDEELLHNQLNVFGIIKH